MKIMQTMRTDANDAKTSNVTSVKIYNRDGNLTGEINAPTFLAAPWNASLVHQVFKSMAANKHRPIAHTKTRGEVSGGGAKPWRQKGTGRARQGSNRSPLWRHGGVTFGPRNTTDFSQKVNKKMLREALQSALSKKLSLNELMVVSTLTSENLKTKEVAKTLNNISSGKSTLLVVANEDTKTLRAAVNIPRLKGIKVKDLNTLDVLTHKYVLIDQKALQQLV